MALVDLFSKRQKRKRGEVPDVYVYDQVPKGLRVQIVQILVATLGGPNEYSLGEYAGTASAYRIVVDTLCREYGVFQLPPTTAGFDRNYLQELADFILSEPEAERVLDAVELSCHVIEIRASKFGFLNRKDAAQKAADAVREVNERFAESGVGYRYEEHEIIRVDSEFVHAEVVKPALAVLCGKPFAGAQDEFLNAHEHYRKGHTKEALNDALKAFESVLKCVCDSQGWAYPAGATSKALLDIVFSKELVPAFWQSKMSGLRALLEGGVPVSRNRLSGHGQGSTPVVVPAHIAAYVLHMTAAAIVFLTQASDAKRQELPSGGAL